MYTSSSSSQKYFSQLLGLAAIAAIVSGVFFRFWQLGGAPLAVDEYYFGSSILNIVERGLPQFACGGFYSRGVLIQYLGALLVLMGTSLEFAVRFWPAIASLLTIVAVWRIAVLGSGRAVACIAVILCSLSVWEIEFARFGRMYAPFQAVVLWYVYYQMLHLIQGRNSAQWIYLALSGISLLIYQGAALLLALNFLPLIWAGKRWNPTHLSLSVLLLIVGVAHQIIAYRYLGVPLDQLPPPLTKFSGGSLPIDLPPISSLSIIMTLIVLLSVGMIFWVRGVRVRFEHPSAIFWSTAALGICFGIMGLGIGLLIAGVLLRLPNPLDATIRRSYRWAAALGGLSLVWILLIYVDHTIAGLSDWTSLKLALMHVGNYPDVYYKALLPWIQAIPATTLVLAMFVAYGMWSFLKNDSASSHNTDYLRYLAAITILLIMLVGILEQPYRTTRYSYFLFPIILILSAVGIQSFVARFGVTIWSRLLVSFSIIGLLFGVTEEYRLSHLININDAQYRFRLAYNNQLSSHYYSRWDYRGVAEFVNSRLLPSDKVIIFDQPATFYLNRTDGVYLRDGTPIHSLTWACGGTRHLWSNAPLLDSESELDSLINTLDGRTWLIMRTSEVPWLERIEISLIDQYNLSPMYVSLDGNLAVYRVDTADTMH